MFTKAKSAPAAKPARNGSPGLSFIGPEVVIDGDVATTAQLHVEGRIDGHVRCAQLCQGVNGTIAGDIVADEARIAGLVEGTVNAGTLIIEASGRVTGDVTYDTISIAAGARVDGRLARRQALVPGAEAGPVLIATPTGAAEAEKAASGGELFAASARQPATADAP